MTFENWADHDGRFTEDLVLEVKTQLTVTSDWSFETGVDCLDETMAWSWHEVKSEDT